jgi:hypothetical protein
MKKERFRMNKIEKKLKMENIERCLNCKLFCRCKLQKEEMVICYDYSEVSDDEQVVVVPLKEWAHLNGNSLFKYIKN